MNGQDGTQKDGSGSGNTRNGSDDLNGAKGSGLSGGKGLMGEDEASSSKDGEAADGRGAQGSGLSGKGANGSGEGADGGRQSGDANGNGLQLVGGAQSDSQASSNDQATGGGDGQGNRNNARVDDAFACAADRNQESRTLRVAQGQSMLAVKGSGVRLARGTCGDAGGSKQSNN